MLSAFAIVGYVVFDKIFLNPETYSDALPNITLDDEKENEKNIEKEIKIFDFNKPVDQLDVASVSPSFSVLETIIVDNQSKLLLFEKNKAEEDPTAALTYEIGSYHLFINAEFNPAYFVKIQKELTYLAAETLNITKNDRKNGYLISAFKTRRQAENIAYQLLRGFGLETKLVKF